MAGGWQEVWGEPASETPVAPAPLPKTKRPVDRESATVSLTEAAVWSHYQPTREELAYRAFKVEQAAENELRNLLQVLDLEEQQQDRVFAALARGSSYYHPSLQPQGLTGTPADVAGATPATVATEAGAGTPAAPVPGGPIEASPVDSAPTDLVRVELTPEQTDVYERYTSERDAFWVGVVEDVENELHAAP